MSIIGRGARPEFRFAKDFLLADDGQGVCGLDVPLSKKSFKGVSFDPANPFTDSVHDEGASTQGVDVAAAGRPMEAQCALHVKREALLEPLQVAYGEVIPEFAQSVADDRHQLHLEQSNGRVQGQAMKFLDVIEGRGHGLAYALFDMSMEIAHDTIQSDSQESDMKRPPWWSAGSSRQTSRQPSCYAIPNS